MKKSIIIIPTLVMLILLISSTAFASAPSHNAEINAINKPSISVSDGVATCSAVVSGSGSIAVTLELRQGSSIIATWTRTGFNYVFIRETANVTSGLVYTLTLSGTVNGVEFNPTSVTVTP